MKKHVQNLYSGRILDLNLEEHQLPDDRQASFEIVRHPGGAAILPLLADGRVVLVRQFRPAIGDMLLEIPAGRLEKGETPEKCAARELVEEVGYRAGRLERMGEMLTAVGFSDERLHLYLARDLTPTERAPEEDEYIEPTLMPVEEAIAMVAAGKIVDGKTQLALLLYQRKFCAQPG